MNKIIRIGTRDSQLAVWQANKVKDLLFSKGYTAELILIKSEGDTNLLTPLYEFGVQGIFTKALDIALLNNEIDIAVHSMKDVPTVLAKGVIQAAVLPRANFNDLLVSNGDLSWYTEGNMPFTIATSSTRRKAQWLNRYPDSTIENLRGNVNTRLRKLSESNWNGAIFAAAGLERIGLRPENAIELDWMLPAPAQGAIIIVCKQNDEHHFNICNLLNDEHTALCTRIERDFLKALLGGCSTPIAGIAKTIGSQVLFTGNILSKEGNEKVEIEKLVDIKDANSLGYDAAKELLDNGGQVILEKILNDK